MVSLEQLDPRNLDIDLPDPLTLLDPRKLRRRPQRQRPWWLIPIAVVVIALVVVVAARQRASAPAPTPEGHTP